ncbi:hypothetical protein ACHAW5_001746 [Stephanodiscus triporus]|uniref:Uncharacterized protein n=1 Tax=Stephanodiscus triporus TaxID=2934178 RepID=A0ABD3QVN0_9STRA
MVGGGGEDDESGGAMAQKQGYCWLRLKEAETNHLRTSSSCRMDDAGTGDVFGVGGRVGIGASVTQQRRNTLLLCGTGDVFDVGRRAAASLQQLCLGHPVDLPEERSSESLLSQAELE